MKVRSWNYGNKIFGVGPLAFDRVAGAGTFSSVWGAYHLDRNQYVAVKIQYHSELDRRQTARFERDGEAELISLWDKACDELEILGTIKSCKRVAGIIEVLNHEAVQARLVVTEFVPYQSLIWDTKAQRYYIPTRNVLELQGAPRAAYRLSSIGFVAVATEVLESLKAIHGLHVFHRDIKPENLRLIGRYLEDEVVKLSIELSDEDEEDCDTSLLTNRGNVDRELLWDKCESAEQILPEEWLEKLDSPDLFTCDPEMDGTWVRLIDFNTAIKSEDDLIWDAEGTTAFTPPEAFKLALNQDRTFSGEKRDVWSLGVLLYAGVTGSLPYWDPSPLAMQCNILSKEISFMEVDELLPADLSNILKCMLRKDPTERSSVTELLAMLRSLCQKVPSKIVHNPMISAQTTTATP